MLKTIKNTKKSLQITAIFCKNCKKTIEMIQKYYYIAKEILEISK